jgi:hypothetical protein
MDFKEMTQVVSDMEYESWVNDIQTYDVKQHDILKIQKDVDRLINSEEGKRFIDLLARHQKLSSIKLLQMTMSKYYHDTFCITWYLKQNSDGSYIVVSKDPLEY